MQAKQKTLSRLAVQPSLAFTKTNVNLKRTRLSPGHVPRALEDTVTKQLSTLRGHRTKLLVAVSRARTTRQSSVVTVTATVRRRVERQHGVTVIFTNLPRVVSSLFGSRIVAFLHHTGAGVLASVPLSRIHSTFTAAFHTSNVSVASTRLDATTGIATKCPCVVRLINCRV